MPISIWTSLECIFWNSNGSRGQAQFYQLEKASERVWIPIVRRVTPKHLQRQQKYVTDVTHNQIGSRYWPYEESSQVNRLRHFGSICHYRSWYMWSACDAIKIKSEACGTRQCGLHPYRLEAQRENEDVASSVQWASFSKDNPWLSSINQVAGNTILPAHAQTWVSVQTRWAGTTALQSYTPPYEKILGAAATGFPNVRPRHSSTSW